jgi:hypothetical protein
VRGWLGCSQLTRGPVPSCLRRRTDNYYCTKTTGRIIGDRSIWDLAPVKRFVAPETFYDQLVDTIGPRIRWSSSVQKDALGDAPLISTIPMPSMLGLCAVPTSQKDFLRAPIAVKRYRLKGVRAYQTIYFPDPVLHVYRASITGSLLIVEYGNGDTGDTRKADEEMEEIAHAFGFPTKQPIELIDESIQRYGKIIPLKTVERKRLLHQLTVEHGVYSLGRFATWRNVLLDDCVQDIDVIRRLLKSNSYDAARFALA